MEMTDDTELIYCTNPRCEDPLGRIIKQRGSPPQIENLLGVTMRTMPEGGVKLICPKCNNFYVWELMFEIGIDSVERKVAIAKRDGYKAVRFHCPKRNYRVEHKY